MLLVPKQLRRAGMTGDVPYYGGRFTPAQAYAAAHPTRRPGPPAGPTRRAPGTDARRALEHLRDAGVITSAEYEDLRARVPA